MGIDEPIETFKMSFLRPLVFVLASSISGIVSIVLLTEGRQVYLVGLAAAVGTIFPLAAIMVAVTNHYFKVHVYTDRLKGYGQAWWVCDLRWAEMESVRPFNWLPLLSYLRISGAGGSRVIWLP